MQRRIEYLGLEFSHHISRKGVAPDSFGHACAVAQGCAAFIAIHRPLKYLDIQHEYTSYTEAPLSQISPM